MFKLGLRGERCAPGKGKACACVCVGGGSSGRKDRFGDPPWGWGAGSKGESSRGGWIGGCSLAAPSLLDSLGVWVSEKPDSSGSGIGSH